MVFESQEPVVAIEQALIALRHGMSHRGPHRGDGHPHAHGGPPWARPASDDGPPWMPRVRGDRGVGDRSLGGAARFRLLDALLSAESEGRRMGVSEVAEAIRVDQPRASRLVNDSAERGLLTRRADERDARRSVIELTDAGRTMLQSARASRRTAVTDALSGFTPEETATFAELLGRFVAAWPR